MTKPDTRKISLNISALRSLSSLATKDGGVTTRNWSSRRSLRKLMACKALLYSPGCFLSHYLPYRFRWVFCQLEMLRLCVRSRFRQLVHALPGTLGDTHERAAC